MHLFHQALVLPHADVAVRGPGSTQHSLHVLAHQTMQYATIRQQLQLAAARGAARIQQITDL